MKTNIKYPQVRLHPLRIYQGWVVSYNTFTEVNPSGLSEDDDSWRYLKESLLQCEHVKKNILIDLGWYPEFNPSGAFKLTVIRNYDWGNPLLLFESKDKTEIIDKIEMLVWQVAANLIK